MLAGPDKARTIVADLGSVATMSPFGDKRTLLRDCDHDRFPSQSRRSSAACPLSYAKRTLIAGAHNGCF